MPAAVPIDVEDDEDGGVVFMKLLFCRWLNVRQNADIEYECVMIIFLNCYVYIYRHAYDAHS